MKILEFSDCETFYCPMTGNIIVSQHMSEESDAVEFVLLRNGFDFMTIKTEYEELYELCRVEALRAGFKQCYQDKDFKTIVQIGDCIPNNLLMEDEVLLQFYDIASSRV